jgi:hypothetical protein
LGSSPFARHYSGSRGFFPFLRLLRCFSSPACHPGPMYSGTDTHALPCVGFPIRRSRGQWMVSSSPGLIAAAHVLLRLLAPRHPPCALCLLIMKNTVFAAMEFSRCARAIPPRSAGPRPVSQNSTAWNVEVDVWSRRARAPDESRNPRDIDGPGACGSWSSRVP